MSAANLTSGEFAAVKKTWGMVEGNAQQSGMDILMTMYKTYPDYKNFFPKWKDTAVDALPSNAAFKAFCITWMNEVSSFVKNLDNKSGLTDIVSANVTNHIPRGLNPTMYQNALNLIAPYLTSKCGGAFDADAKSGWKKTVDGLVSIIKTKM